MTHSSNNPIPEEAPERQPLASSWRRKPWHMLGIGYYFAWMVLVVISVANLVVVPQLHYPLIAVRVSFSSTITIALVFVMFFSKRFDALNSGKWVLAFAAGSSALGTTLLVFALNFVSSFSLLVVSTILIGFGNAVLLLSWGEFFQHLPFGRLSGHVALSCLFAACLCALAGLLPPFARFALVISLPVASGLTLIFCTNEQGKLREHDAIWHNGMTKILASCIIASIFLGAVRSLPSFNASFRYHSEAVFATMAVVFALGLLCLVLMGRKAPVVFLYRLCMPLMVVGYGLFMFDSPATNILSIALILCGNILFECLILLIYPFVSIRTKVSRVYLFGLGVVGLHVGSLIGALLGNWFSASEAFNQLSIAVFCLLSVFFLMVLFFYIFRELDIVSITKTVDGETASKSIKDPIAKLAAERRLSPRETEVLHLLANGRSLPYIESTLYISHSTAKTHVKHIYEKMGVGNRQQLHDLIQSI